MQPEVNPRNFQAGDRVRYTVERQYWLTHPHYFASITPGMVMCIDATPYITGTVTKVHPLMGVAIRPDGWPVKVGEGCQGFYAFEPWLERVHDSAVMEGILTDPRGNPLTNEQIENEIASYQALRA